ncbi:maleylpyruvate isomerase N-terminal domain-containing protein [Mycobacterium sp.]|uniref:maleylpyruvate isomerase N-terminal domain-containing protein n=1 Tax=Mycobacterium sp. TaxID=1785 RepID=UPI002CEAA309|nr:maleylpyruvate isomerase N-terminal domain-containing protein [Mycobacterium sp.]HTQ21674.1 maleylpyruvate isomerase N-terminal domain-containing protein [Mycobacterium sp.]
MDDTQLATPSLCAGWDVKTVGAHIVSTVLDGTPAFLRLAVRRGSLSRAIDELARRGGRAPTSLPARAGVPIAGSVRRCSGRSIRSPTSWCTAGDRPRRTPAQGRQSLAAHHCPRR